MQPVGQLYQDHPDVIGHGDQHLAEVLCLILFLGLEMDLADLGHPVNQFSDFLAEHLGQFFRGGQGILNGIMEKTGHNAGNIQLQTGKESGNFKGMDNIRLTGKAGLALMHLGQ